MLRLSIFLLLLLEPLLTLARPQYFCGIPCPLTKPCNSGSYNSCCKCPGNSNGVYDDEPYCACPINLTVNCCADTVNPARQSATTTTTTATTTTTTTPPPTPPQPRSGEEPNYRRSGGGGRSNMLTSLFSIPGAVADTFLSGEVTL